MSEPLKCFCGSVNLKPVVTSECADCGAWHGHEEPKYKLKLWEAGDWFELTKINPDGTESDIEILGSQHDKLCAYWSIVKDLGVKVETVMVPDEEEDEE